MHCNAAAGVLWVLRCSDVWNGANVRHCPVAGAYLSDCQIGQPATAGNDMEMAAELWAETEKQLKAAEAKLKA